MYVRLIRCHLKGEVEPCRTAIIYDELLPAISAFDGFLGTSLMSNNSARAVVAMVYWDTEEHAQIAGEALRPTLFRHTWELTDSPLDITGYQVIHHSMVEG